MPEARHVTGKDLDEELARKECCVVEFWMHGCPACARFASTFSALALELQERANVCAIEARQNIEVCKKHGIEAVPTVVVFKSGEEVQRTTGSKTLEEMREWLEPALV